MARRSIEVPGLQHGAPIPQASVVGNLLVSGGISPVDPETGVTPDGADEQVAMVFANVRRVLAAAGGTTGDIVKCTVFVQDKAIRPVVNKLLGGDVPGRGQQARAAHAEHRPAERHAAPAGDHGRARGRVNSAG